MRIIVCIKSIAGSFIKNIGREVTINPYDLYALDQARKIKENTGCEIICINMGVANSLIQVEAESYGCDKTIFLSDKKFSQADTLATSLTLVEAIRKIGDFDYIFCGAVSLDGETGQIAPNIASMLGVPFMGNISEVQSENECLHLLKRQEDKTYMYESVRGMVVGFDSLIIGKVLNLFQVKKASKIAMDIWDAQDMHLNASDIGEKGSRTKVINVKSLDSERLRQCKVYNDVDRLVDYINQNLRIGTLVNE